MSLRNLKSQSPEEEAWLALYSMVLDAPAFSSIKEAMKKKEASNANLRVIKRKLVQLKNQLSGSDLELCESLLHNLMFI